MRVLKIAVFGTALCAGMSGCASPDGSAAGAVRSNSAPDRPCFSAQRVVNFRSDDGLRLYVRAMDRQVFELGASGYCDALQSSVSIALQPEFGSDRLCEGDTAIVTTSSPTPAPCRVRVGHRLTAAEVAALPGRLRP